MVSFLMHVNIWADDLKINANENKDAVIKWYTEMNYDKQNFRVEYVISNVFKITYDTDDENEDRCMMETVADPDDDGNYPIKIKGRMYLIAGKIIDNTISRN